MQNDPRPEDSQAPSQEETAYVKPPMKHTKVVQIVCGIVLALVIFVLLYFSSRPEIYFRYGWVAAFGLTMIITYSLEKRYQRRYKLFWKTFLITAGAALLVMLVFALTGIAPLGV